jgi:transaldolase
VKENRMAETPLQQLQAHGQSVWIDYLSRPFIENGELAGLVREGVTGVTSNPTIFQGAIADGDAYDEQLREVLQRETDPKEVFLALARNDIRRACELLHEEWARGGADRDGWVSLEVDPSLAYDTEATVAEAARLHEMVERPNLFVKIPATEAGLPAIEETIARGIPVNVTLIFSLERHRKVAKAYIAGLERLVENGGDPSTVASVASFFVSRVDTEADKRLDAIGGHDELKGTLAIANAKLAYRTYQEVFSGAEWEALAAKGATPQRCLWASTSTKNPEYRDVIYVEELIGPHTVNTMPRETVEAFLDHGRVEETLTRDVAGAERTLEALAEAGIDYDDVVATLEREGVEKFAKSFEDLIKGIEEKRDAMVAA